MTVTILSLDQQIDAEHRAFLRDIDHTAVSWSDYWLIAAVHDHDVQLARMYGILAALRPGDTESARLAERYRAAACTSLAWAEESAGVAA